MHFATAASAWYPAIGICTLIMSESIDTRLYSPIGKSVCTDWPGLAAILFVVSSRKRDVKNFQADDRVVSFRDRLQIQLRNYKRYGWMIGVLFIIRVIGF